MTKLIHPVAHCDTMLDVRRNIDALDQRIVALMAERSGYVAQAARIKQDANLVHDQARIDFIVARVSAMAAEQGAPAAVIEVLDLIPTRYSARHKCLDLWMRLDARTVGC